MVVPAEEVARALESLTAREVITSRQPHRFTVDLHRLWLSRHRSLEWVRHEIDGSITEWRQPPASATTPRPSDATARPPRLHDQAAERLGADEPVRSPRRSDSPRFRIRWISDWPVVPTEEQARVPLSTWAREHRLAPDDLFDGRLEVVDKTSVIVQEEWVEESRIEALQRRPGRFPVESLGLPTYRGSIQQAPGPPNKWTSQVWRGLLDGSTSVLECRLCINGKVRCSKCEGTATSSASLSRNARTAAGSGPPRRRVEANGRHAPGAMV